MPTFLVSTTLAGAGTAGIIGTALRSVAPWVDKCLVIDTSGVASEELAAASREAAGDKLVMRQWAWRDDFAAARNAALDLAAEIAPVGGWAITVDTDEWIELRGEDVRAVLASVDVPCVYMAHSTGNYWQPRAIRLPCAARWGGRVHEAIPIHGPKLAKACFGDRPKTPEQMASKRKRDAAILREVTAERPNEPRWWYYLGDALAALDEAEEAVAAFRRCADLRGWDEEGAWACYRAADLLSSVLGRHDEAVEACAFGMSRHAGVAELPWIAALASWRAGRHAQAVYWARLAEVHGAVRHQNGFRALDQRILFRCDQGLQEGPSDVLRFALKEVGDAAGAADAETTYRTIRARRG